MIFERAKLILLYLCYLNRYNFTLGCDVDLITICLIIEYSLRIDLYAYLLRHPRGKLKIFVFLTNYEIFRLGIAKANFQYILSLILKIDNMRFLLSFIKGNILCIYKKVAAWGIFVFKILTDLI